MGVAIHLPGLERRIPDAGVVCIGPYRERRTRLELGDSCDLPASECQSVQAMYVLVRQLVNPVDYRNVAGIEIRRAPEIPVVVIIERDVKARRAVIVALR